MKHFVACLVLQICGVVCFCQSLIVSENFVQETEQIFDNLTINEGVIFENRSQITVRNTLLIEGKLINNGNIFANNCTIDGEVCSFKKENELQAETIILQNVHFPIIIEDENYEEHIAKIISQNIVVEGNTSVQSCYISADFWTINGELEFTGKLGVKTVGEFLTINGLFNNSDNENIQIYGDIRNDSENTCEGANFDFFGAENHIYGDFSFYRLKIEGDCYNHDSVAVKETFTGEGRLIQTEHSHLQINTTNSPEIIATATGNTLEYTRGGFQELNCSACYNLVLSKIGGNSVKLMNDLQIAHNLTFTKKSFLNCGDYTLLIQNTNETTISCQDFSCDRGIVSGNGTVQLQNCVREQQIFVPLFCPNNNFAGLKLFHNQVDSKTFEISATNSVGFWGEPFEDELDQDFVNITWQIQGDFSNAQADFLWQSNSELPNFNISEASVVQSVGESWAPLVSSISPAGSYNSASALIFPNRNFSVRIKSSLLPIVLEEFSVTPSDFGTIIHWQSHIPDAQFYCVEKLFGTNDFCEIARFSQQKSGDYSFIDKTTNTANFAAYRIAMINTKGETDYSDILTIQLPPTPQFQYFPHEKTLRILSEFKSVSVRNLLGITVLQSIDSVVNLSNLTSGTYIITIQKSDRYNSWQILVE